MRGAAGSGSAGSGSAARVESVLADGGVVLFPSDTVYGLCCAPDDAAAVARLYAIKRRPVAKSAAVMFFSLEAALAAVPELEPFRALLPGGVTLLLPNHAGRFPLSCAGDRSVLGVRVVDVPVMRGVSVPVLQSSANLSGGADAQRLADVDPAVRRAVDCELDGGTLPGVASTVLDVRRFAADRSWSVVRAGAVPEAAIRAALGG